MAGSAINWVNGSESSMLRLNMVDGDSIKDNDIVMIWSDRND
jgi:hypothetical protein